MRTVMINDNNDGKKRGGGGGTVYNVLLISDKS